MRGIRPGLFASTLILGHLVGMELADPVWPRNWGWLVYFLAGGLSALLLYAAADRVLVRRLAARR